MKARTRKYNRWWWCRHAAWMSLVVAASASAQQGTAVRYYITSDQVSTAEYQSMVEKVLAASADNDERTGIVAQLYYPWARLSAVAAVMEPEQMQRLLGDPSIVVRSDVPLRPAATAGPDWPLTHWLVPQDAGPGIPAEPVVYLVDTGVATAHDDFAYAPSAATLNFLPGMSFAFDYTTLPRVPISPHSDPYDHGTRVAGCLGGRTTGLLGPLGGRAQVQSIVIYDVDPGFPPTTFASQAIQAILWAIADHSARRALPYLKNHASVLVFPHTTTVADGRLADLDQTVDLAWQSGLHVILAAGNEGAAAVEVSPAGAGWGYVLGGNPTRFFFGAKPPGATWFRAVEAFLTIGGDREIGGGDLAISTLTNVNVPDAPAIDVFAPGEAVPCPSATGLSSYAIGAGTSLATGFSAAMVAWAAYQRPWVRPGQARDAVRDAATHAFGFPKAETPVLPASLTYRQWIDHFFPEPEHTLAERDPLADPDDDGVPNLVEFACGQDPRFADANIRPRIFLSPSPSSSTITVSMPTACHLGSPGLVTWELQTSSDLVHWTPLPTGALTPVEPPVIEGDGRRWAADAVGPSAPPGSAWFRIRFSAVAPLL